MNNKENWVFITPKHGLEYGINSKKFISVKLGYDPEQISFLPNQALALELTPTEARQMANTLLRMASLAEEALSHA